MTKFSMKKKYDSLKGYPIREIKSNDIVQVAANYAHVAAGSTMDFTALDSDTELFITGFSVSFGAAGEAYVTVDTSTILPIRRNAAGVTTLKTNLSAPLFKADASSTISIAATDAGSYSAFLWGVRHPTFENVETSSTA